MTTLQDYSVQYWDQIAKEEQARQLRYKKGWQYYRGEHQPTLQVKVGQPDDNLIMNLFAYIIDKGVSFLFGKDVDFQIEEGKQTEEEQFLSDVWARNKKMSLLQDVALNGSICGHCFVEIVPRENNVPRLINLDPAIVRPQWDSDDLEKVLWYKIEYPTLDPIKMKMVYKKRMIELQGDGTWLITKYTKMEGQPNYQQEGTPVAWEYEFPPIVDWKNLPAPNEYFGKADIENLSGQDSINFQFSNTQRILRYHGHPKTIGTGFQAGQVQIAPDEMIVLPSENAKVTNLEMQSNLEAGRVFLQDLIDMWMQTNHTPNVNPQKVSIGALSGFALRILYADLLDQTEKKRRLYGDGLEEINRRLRVLANVTDPKPTKMVWQSPLPENKAEIMTALEKEIDLGLTSKQTAQMEIGRDPETEQARMEGERLQGDSVGAQLLRAFNAGTGQGTIPNDNQNQPVG